MKVYQSHKVNILKIKYLENFISIPQQETKMKFFTVVEKNSNRNKAKKRCARSLQKMVKLY